MAALKPEFVEGCRASGTRPEVIEFLWQTNEKSADYSFNKSHAACYGLIAYRTAWLKANHTAEYMAALISSVMSTKDKVPFFVARCEEMGIEILPPDVNLSDHEFTVVDDLMATMKDKFLEGCQASNTQRKVADDLWSLMTAAADYSFNKSHAACYALISYRTAWLKANYPAEYMAALISSVMDTKDKVPFFVNQTEAMGIEILPPDVNESDHEFMVRRG